MAFSCKLLPNSTLPYFSTGHVQLHHIIEDILNQTGEADLFISSFTVAEEFIRKLYKYKEQNLIKSLTLLIDLRSSKKLLHLTYFLSQVADEVYLANNHSKIMLIKNKQHHVSVVTSQNQTRGNRFEAGMICTQKHVYDFYKKQIDIQLPKCLPIGNLFTRNT